MNTRFILLLTATLLLSLSAFIFFPQLELFSDRIALFISLAIFCAQAFAIIHFLTSLQAFKKQLRTAYIMLSVGILFFGLTQLQIPIGTLEIVDPLLLSWAIVGSSLLGSCVMYIAIRKFARLMNIKTIWQSYIFTSLTTLAIVYVASFIPHDELPYDEIVIDAIYGMFMASGVVSLISAVNAISIRQKIGQQYKAAMGWLAGALMMASLACIHETIVKLLPFFNQEQFIDYFAYGYSLWPFLIASLLFLMASLSFKMTRVIDSRLPDTATTLDIIDYTVRLASNPAALDLFLDKVRGITAMKSEDELTTEDEKELQKVYLDLENYLVTREPLRKFTREELRGQLPERFSQKLSIPA